MALDAEVVMLTVIYAAWHLCCVAFMLSVASKLNMLNVVMLNVLGPFSHHSKNNGYIIAMV